MVEENPAIVQGANSWIIMNPGGGPTPDKPDISLAPPASEDTVSSFLNVRVADIAAFYTHATQTGRSSSPSRWTEKPRFAATCATPMATSSRSARPPACVRESSPIRRLMQASSGRAA